MTALADLKAAQLQIQAATVDTIDALYLAATNALKVPNPPGDPSNIEMLAATLRKVAGNWTTAQQDLTVVANTRVPAMWQGETMTLAKGLITNVANDLAALPTAFDAAARALSTWADQLSQAQHQYEKGRSDLNQAVTSLGRNLNDPDRLGVTDPNNDTSLRDLFPSSHKAALDGIDQMVSAASAIDSAAQALITLLNELATTGVPAAPGAAPVEGATAALTALGAPPPDLANAVSEANDAANLIALQNSGGQLTPAEQARLNDELNREADNPLFATTLLQDLGPQGFLTWASRVEPKLLPPGSPDSGDPGQYDEAARLLAAATRGTPGEPTLSASWLADLTKAEGQRYDPDHKNLYGYQVIGQMLLDANAPFSGSFLTRFGDDAIAFELSQGGADHAWGEIGNDPTLGVTYDPIYDVLSALQRNPAAAASFLNQSVFDIPGMPAPAQIVGATAPPSAMVDYLLHRPWMGNWDEVQDANGVLGNVFAAATQDTGNQVDRNLAQYIILDIGTNMAGKVPSGMAGGLGDLLVNYISSGDVNDSYGDGGLFVGSLSLDNVLKSISQDGLVNDKLTGAEILYTDRAVTLTSPANFPQTGETGMYNHLHGTLNTAGRVLNVLAQGKYQMGYHQVADPQQDQAAAFQFMKTLASSVLSYAPTPQPVQTILNLALNNVIGGGSDQAAQVSGSIQQQGYDAAVLAHIKDVVSMNPYLVDTQPTDLQQAFSSGFSPGTN